MSATDRQNRLLVAEDWKRIYQSFRNADFQSYDFENLRRIMIQYIRENYPEDFNDYIESSEYLALIDLIAFLGQSISYRTDLNARDNFLELADRRESVLRLARLLSYNAKRNIAASGLLKFSTISTTENVYDSNGKNLAGQVISWNDLSNSNWYDQFIKVINATLPATRQFGNPDKKGTVYSIPTEQYRFQSSNTDVPVYAFTKPIDGDSTAFEIVSTTFEDDGVIYEEPPLVGNRLAFVYRNDGKGTPSINTGFYLHFRQGSLSQGTFNIAQPSTNESIDIDQVNINNSDVWLYRLDQSGVESEFWAGIPALEGNNVIYNSLNKAIKNIYSVVTKAGDRISLTFSDGTFGNLPRGTFRVYYRTSNGANYTINPRDIKNVTLNIPYVSNTGQAQTLTLSVALHTSIDNSSPSETSASIKANAPATYYTQNRMITGEDYNISPLAVSQEILKIKSVNRSSSGISRYFDLVDPTGKYSKTNLFADDGALYKEDYSNSFKFAFLNKTDIEEMIVNRLAQAMATVPLRDFYYSKFFKIITDSLNVSWYLQTSDTNQSTGYIGDVLNAAPYKCGTYTSTNLRFLTTGALLKFNAPAGKYFDKNNNNKLVTGDTNTAFSTNTLWAQVISVAGDGTNNNTGILISGEGTILLNDIIPLGAILSQIIPAWRTVIDTNTMLTIVDLMFANKPFGLRYDIEVRSWKIVFEVNLNLSDTFSLGKQGDNSNIQLDSSWLLLFTTDTEYYTVKYRQLRYIFESDKQLRFYFDSSDKIYDTRNNTIVKDKIKILSINTQPDSTSPFTYDREWELTDEFKGLDGYVDTKKIEVTFADTDDDGIADNPEVFEDIVASSVSSASKYVVLERYLIAFGQEDYRLYDNSKQTVLILNSQLDISSIINYKDGQYFYFIDANVVKQLIKSSATFIVSTDYKLYVGRRDIKFQYIHNADYESRIDPGLTNLIDIFVLTKQHDIAYRRWMNGSLSTMPLPPSSDYLYSILSPELNKIKSISDEIIYHPVQYKILFGSKATPDVQAVFKVVKNLEVVISDNDVKARVLAAINEFFAIENWDFGNNFYFSELSAYVLRRLSPNIVNFLIVPRAAELTFGSLYEIRSEKDQLFINGATIQDIEIISAVSASKLKSTGAINITSYTTNTQSITSGGNT